MSYLDNDVYYNPEKFGLTIVGEAEVPPCYDFDMFVVWRDEAGALYYAEDAGCSCPSPFEDFTSVDKLTKAASAQEVHEALDAWVNEYNGKNVGESAHELHAKLADLKIN